MSGVEQFEGQLTPEEAKAVLDLHHLRERQREEDRGFVLVDELREVLGVSPDEMVSLIANVRAVLPARAAVSEDRVNQQEAELIVARNARQAAALAEPLPEVDPQILADVRSRSKELSMLERKGYSAGPQMEYEVAVGEHPHSWAIMWSVLGGILLVLGILIVFFRR